MTELEAVALVEPVGGDGGIEDEFAHLGGRPLRGELVVGLGDFGQRRGRIGRVESENGRGESGEETRLKWHGVAPVLTNIA